MTPLASRSRRLPAWALRLFIVGAALAFVTSIAAPAQADGATRARTLDLTPGEVRAPALALAVHPPRAATASERTRRVRLRRARSYSTVDGYRVAVRVSARYGASSAADQRLVDFLGSLVHGEEMEGLKVMILTPDEVRSRCGSGAAACYFPGRDLMVIVGERNFGGLPTDYVIAHEYGHRIAQYRLNPPFEGGAFTYGTKRWATEERICPAVRRGRLSIDGSDYWNSPGEGFAEAYARLNEPGALEWQFSPYLRPTQSAMLALRRDIRNPWHEDRAERVRGRLRPGEVDLIRIGTSLDGRLWAGLDASPGASFRMTAIAGGRRVAGSSGFIQTGTISHVICGDRSVQIRIHAGSRAGRYRLRIAKP